MNPGGGLAFSALVSVNEVTLRRARLVLEGLPSEGGQTTQPSTLSGTENEHQPKCGGVLRLGSKGRYGSFHLWMNVWVACKTV